MREAPSELAVAVTVSVKEMLVVGATMGVEMAPPSSELSDVTRTEISENVLLVTVAVAFTSVPMLVLF